MYDNKQSKYCYLGTEVLINLQDFRVKEQLDVFEKLVTTEILRKLELKPISGQFGFKHLCNIHSFLFKEVYPFAGKVREEDISKDGFPFCLTQFIDSEAGRIFGELKSKNYLQDLSFEDHVNGLAYFMAELNVLHPFREGNGRTQREFIRCLARKSNWIVDWAKVNHREILEATIQSVRDLNPLVDILNFIISKDPI